jgi:hypothetical protein
MRELTVLYDAQCGLCRRFKDWLAAQRPGPNGKGGVVRLRFVAAGSADARALYPGLDHAATLREVTVVADDGSVYVGDGRGSCVSGARGSTGIPPYGWQVRRCDRWRGRWSRQPRDCGG